MVCKASPALCTRQSSQLTKITENSATAGITSTKQAIHSQLRK